MVGSISPIQQARHHRQQLKDCRAAHALGCPCNYAPIEDQPLNGSSRDVFHHAPLTRRHQRGEKAVHTERGWNDGDGEVVLPTDVLGNIAHQAATHTINRPNRGRDRIGETVQIRQAGGVRFCLNHNRKPQIILAGFPRLLARHERDGAFFFYVTQRTNFYFRKGPNRGHETSLLSARAI